MASLGSKFASFTTPAIALDVSGGRFDTTASTRAAAWNSGTGSGKIARLAAMVTQEQLGQLEHGDRLATTQVVVFP